MINIIFLGSGDFAEQALSQLHTAHEHLKIVAIITQPPKPVGRKKILTPTTVEQHNTTTPLFHANSSQEIINIFQENKFQDQIDFLIVADYGVILSSEVLALPKIDSLNIHGSLLPHYRGASPIQQTLLNQDLKTGISIIKMTPELDAGDILTLTELPVAPEDDQITLTEKLGKLGGQQLIETLINYHKKTATPQEHLKATYCYKIKKSDAEITPQDSTAQQVYAKFKAFKKWPNLYTVFGSKKIIILDCHLIPAQTTTNDKQFIYLNYPDYSLKITQVKPENKTQMSTADFLRGHHPQ